MSKLGRPKTYKLSMGKKSEDYLAKGYSKRALCAHLKISQQTLWKWIKEYPDFNEHIERGVSRCEEYYLEQGKSLIEGKTRGNANVLFFFMKNILRYSDTPTEAEESKPININFTIKTKDEE